jgi:RNA polymerase sigma-70 factor (ECF subfamily)
MARVGGPGVDADDLLQELFVVALNQAHRFGDAGPPRPWLYGVAFKLLQAARRKVRFRRFLGLEVAEEPSHPETPGTLFEHREASQRLYAMLDQLSEKKRTVIILYEIEGWKGEEIAAQLGCPLKTVWTRLFHARRDLEALVEQERGRTAPEVPDGA